MVETGQGEQSGLGQARMDIAILLFCIFQLYRRYGTISARVEGSRGVARCCQRKRSAMLLDAVLLPT
jgi:hypothetical protein